MLNEMMFRPVVKPEVVEYMRKSQRFFPGKLGELEQMANDLGIPIIPHETAVYLDFLLGLYRPTHILEIGTAIGYSSIIMNRAYPDSSITTIEIDEKNFLKAKEFIKKAGCEKNIDVIYADANGYFSFVPVHKGYWGFAALGAGGEMKHNGKELSQDAVLWIEAK